MIFFGNFNFKFLFYRLFIRVEVFKIFFFEVRFWGIVIKGLVSRWFFVVIRKSFIGVNVKRSSLWMRYRFNLYLI